MEQAEKILDMFLNNDNTVSRISSDEARDLVQMSIHYLNDYESTDDVKKKCFKVLCNVIIYSTIPTEEKWVIYWTITYACFTNTFYDEYNDYVISAYKTLFYEVKDKMPKDVLYPKLKNNEDGPIVITTSQFLSEAHAPTRRVLDYANTITNCFGKKVIIINEAGMHLKEYDYMNEAPQFSYIEDLSDVYELEYKGNRFVFYQSSYKMLDFQEIANIIYNIRNLNPSLVLNVGENSITSDLCTSFVKTATIPCGTSIPISMAENLIMCRNVREDDWDRIDKIEQWQNVISSVFNYIMPDETCMKHYTRADFGIDEDSWVIASAGNRMDVELTEEFLITVDKILDSIDDSRFLIIGTYNNQKKIEKIMKNANKVILAGSVQDGSQAVRLANVYIQPKRKGGGRAAFEALYYGVPVVLLKYGDAWDVCGQDFEVANYDEMIKTVCEYYNNLNKYQIMQELSFKRGKILEDMPGMFTELFNDLEMKYNIMPLSVDISKFNSIFKTEYEIDIERTFEWQKKIEKDIQEINNLVRRCERKIRTNEWATVFNSTIRGVDWLKDVSLSPGRCAIDYPGLYTLYRVLDEIRPDRILEIGLGQSTKVIGAYAEKYEATHYIVEHDREWINFFFDKHNKNDKTEVVYVDRIDGVYNGRYINTVTPIFYYDNFGEKIGNQKFDFIFIDGPQGSQEYSRVDVTELLPEVLPEDFVIMIDDSERNGERRTIHTIMQILTDNGIDWVSADVDGQKNTCIIVSSTYAFLCSI